MWIALRKQAETYFQSISDVEKAHNDSIVSGELERFYTLLICHCLPSAQLTTQILNFHVNKTIKWDTFIDAIWGFSLSLAEDHQLFKTLASFVSQMDSKNIVERTYLMKSLPQNLIDAAGLEKKQTLDRKTNRAYTKFYYDQKKHNLLRENNQGYAKLCLLFATMNYSHPSQIVWNKVLSLIGNFDLDPDRVLDLLIESYVQSANSQICLNLIKNFNPQSIVALIGNRILKDCSPQQSQRIIYVGKIENFLTGTPSQLFKQLQNSINPKLISILCRLIKQNVIKLQLVVPYLNPADSVLEREQSKRLQSGKQKIVKSFKLMMEEPTRQQVEKIKEQQNLRFSGQLLFSSKLALMNGFVCANDWYNFSVMWKKYQNKIDLLTYQPLLRSLLHLLEWVIDPLYSKISLAKYFKCRYQSVQTVFKISVKETEMEEDVYNKDIRKQMTQCESLNQNQFQKILQILELIKIYIGFHTKIYIKICRLFLKIMIEPSIFGIQKANQSMPEQNVYYFLRNKIQHATKTWLLPGISLQTNNPALAKELFELLEHFDYRFRYSCYLLHYSETMTNNPYLANIFFKTRNKQISIVNNMSDKNKKVYMRKMAKITHNQALQTFYWIFRRILMEDYEKVVPEIVNVLANCCSLTLEMSIFIGLHILNEQKQPAMNFKTGQQAPWFKNLINFISLFYRKYLEIDIQPVFDYIIMKVGQPVEELELNEELPGALLTLLHQILSKMYCNFVLKEVDKKKQKLQMLCAGPKLQLQALDISQQIKASKKSKVILQKFFWGKSVDQYDGQSLAISLLVLLTQKRAELLHKSYISNLKIIGDIYDDYTVIIIQLIRVLNELSSGYSQYAKLLPDNSLGLLINQYKLPMEIAFQIYRPSIKHISSMDKVEWTRFVGEVGQVLNKFILSQQKYINRYSDNEKLKTYLNENYSKINNVMSHQFFTTFWMLTLDSIYFPDHLYMKKLKDLEKAVQTKARAKNQKYEREIQKLKTLFKVIREQQQQQSKKYIDTIQNQENASRLKVDFLKNGTRDQKNASMGTQQFAQIFVQICLLPRMMLDPEEALYCMKITLEVIKINKLTPGKSIKFLLYIIEHVMNYIPYCSERQASDCLSIFLSEMLSVTINWNDSAKLQQDLKNFLAIDENFVDENYLRLRKQFIKLYVRFGNIVKSIKDQPYSIRNCLYLLQKVDAIPAYKQQAQSLEEYLKQLKEKFGAILSTILEIQLPNMAAKKKILPFIQQEGQTQFRPEYYGILPVGPSPFPMKSEQQPKFNSNNEKNLKGGEEKKDNNKKQTKVQKVMQKQKVKEKQSEKNPILQKQKTPLRSQQAQKTEKPSSLMEDETKQIQQKQTPKVLDNKQQKNTFINTSPINVPGPSAVTQTAVALLSSPVPINMPQIQGQSQIGLSSLPPIQTVAQRRAAEQEKQKQKERGSIQKQKMETQPKPDVSPSQQLSRIKTVAEMRQQTSKKAMQNQQTQVVQVEPQIHEKLIKQIKKDQTQRNQIAQWPKQEQKRDRPKTHPSQDQPNSPIHLIQSMEFNQPCKTTVQFRKNSIQEKRDEIQNWPKSDRVPIQKEEKQINIQIIPKLAKADQSIIEISNPLTKSLLEKSQQDRQKQQQNLHNHSHSRSKDKIQEVYKIKDNKVQWTNKIDRQDRYSPEKKQARQRLHKRENRPYEKDRHDRDRHDKDRQQRDRQQRDRLDRDRTDKKDNIKDQRMEGRWKEREDYREKHNQDRNSERHKEEKDRSSNRRKQDKYDREKDRDRKHEKGRERSRDRQRQRDYRK